MTKQDEIVLEKCVSIETSLGIEEVAHERLKILRRLSNLVPRLFKDIFKIFQRLFTHRF